MSRVKWVEHKGKKILYVDYRGQKTTEAMIETVEESTRIEAESPTKVLVLVNYEDSAASIEYMARVKELGKEIRTQKVLKTALLGITGLKMILYQGYIRFTGETTLQIFTDETAALDWLAE
jgi:hypothetical protein